jgi:hypothetical protein
VRLSLVIGQYDNVFVDAYYGPDSLKPIIRTNPTFPKDSLLTAVKTLIRRTGSLYDQCKGFPGTAFVRIMDPYDQLMAAGRRVRIYSGEYGTFDEESKDLFGVVAPTYDEAHYEGHR